MRRDEFFDLTVPGAWNYVAEGVVNHNTGIGKGRVMAAMIHWAGKNDMLPVFFTAKPDLYAAMQKDFDDIGVSKSVFMTDSDKSIPLDPEAIDWQTEAAEAKAHGLKVPERRGRFLETPPSDKQANEMRAIMAGLKDYDAIFTTYDQTNSIKGEDTVRRQFLRQIAPRAMLVLDEAHKAGGGAAEDAEKVKGAPPRSIFVREIAARAGAVIYSSATYAKNPKVMDLYLRTNMAKAVENINQLPDLIAKGGVPLQQAVAAMLAKDGQYIRRERSFHGVSYVTDMVPVDQDAYAAFTAAVRNIFAFDMAIGSPLKGGTGAKMKAMEESLDAVGAVLGKDPSLGETSASSTEFSSIMHNVVSQMLLSIKAKSAAEQIMQAIDRGEKPIVVVANTMESFLQQYAADNSINVGDPIDLSFKTVLQRYLKRTLRVLIKGPDGSKKYHFIPLELVEKHAPGVSQLYQRAELAIELGNFGHLPASPIDYIRSEITKAGHSVAEITGRKSVVIYGDDSALTLGDRPKRELGASGKLTTMNGFQVGKKARGGGVDVIIGNESMAEGISLHANAASDMKQRHMFIVQSHPNIDVFMQLVGRPHRTGQVVLPKYTQLSADVPAEARPAAVQAKKMASLNANTTAARRGSFSTNEAIDFMNAYGDTVAANVLDEDPELNANLGSPLTYDEAGRPNVRDVMRKATGRLVLLHPDEQQRFLDILTSKYKEHIDRLDALGLNALEAKFHDLQAETKETKIVKPGSGHSEFTKPVSMETTLIKAPGRAMLPKDILEAIGNGLETPMQKLPDMAKALDIASRAGFAWKAAQMSSTTRAYNTYAAGQIADAGDKADKKRAALAKDFQAFTQIMDLAHPGARITFPLYGDDLDAVVTDVKRAGKGKNPAGLGSWELTVAVPDGARSVVIPFSRIDLTGRDAEKFAIARPKYATNWGTLIKAFEEANVEGKEKRLILTGNILAGFDIADGKGQIVNYTNDKGAMRSGILMPRGKKAKDIEGTIAVRFKNPDQIAQYLFKTKGEVLSVDGLVHLIGPSDYSPTWGVDMPAARATGGKYYTEPSVREAVGESFEKKGSRMAAYVNEAQFQNAVRALMKLGAVFETRQHQTEANDIVNPRQGVDAASMRILPGDKRKPVFGRDIPETAATKALWNDARSIILRVAGHAATIRGVPDIPYFRHNYSDASEKAVAEGGGNGGPPGIVGRYQGNHITPYDSVITVALDYRHYKDTLLTAYHEALHMIQEWVMSPAERALLDRDHARMRFLAAKAIGIDPHGAAIMDFPRREIEAYALQEYIKARDEGRDPEAGMHIGIRRIFMKVYEVIRGLRRLFRNRGFKTYQDVFDAVWRGDFGRRLDEQAAKGTFEYRGGAGDGVRSGDVGKSEREIIKDRLLRDGLLSPDQADEWMAHGTDSAAVRTGGGGSSSGGAGGSPPEPPSFWRRRANATLRRVSGSAERSRIVLQDSVLDMRRWREMVKAETGLDVPVNLDLYVNEALFHGRVGARLDDMRRDFTEPLIKRMQALGVNAASLDDYLYANHALDRNEVTRGRDPRNDEGSGVSDAWANHVIRGIESGPKAAAYRELAQTVYDFIQETRDGMVRDGLISQKQADEWVATMGRYYVPLRGHEEGPDENDGPGAEFPHTGGGYDIRGRESKSALGRRSKADSPLAYVLMQGEQAIVRGQKNIDVDQTMLRAAQRYPDKDVWEIIKGRMIRTLDPVTGMVRERWQPVNAKWNDPNVFGAKVGGQQSYVRINRPALARAMRNAGPQNFGSAFRFMARIMHAYKALRTSYSVEFMVTNPTKDIQDALIQLGDVKKTPKGVRVKMLKSLPKSLAGILTEIRDPGSNQEYAAWFREFRHGGGEITFNELHGIEATKKQIDRLFNRGKMGSVIHAVGDAVSNLSRATENMTRLAVFVTLRRAGVGVKEAAFAAREMTVNFTRHGEWGPGINLAFAFSNASIQGTARMLGALRRSRAVKASAVLIMMTGFALSVINRMISQRDDKDGKGTSSYDNIADYRRHSNWLVMNPLQHDANGDMAHFAVPVPYGYSMFYAAGAILADLSAGATTPGKAAADITAEVMQSMSPIPVTGGLAQAVTPSVLQPIVQSYSNKNWHGGDIAPEKYDRHKPDSENYFSNVSPLAKTLARILNEYSGGNVGKAGAIDISPGTIELWADFFGGGTARDVGNAVFTGERLLHGDQFLPERAPVVRRFYDAPTTVSKSREFFDAWDQVDAAHYEMTELRKPENRGGAGARIDELRQTPEARAYAGLSHQKDLLDANRARQKTVAGSPILTPEQKTAQLKNLGEAEQRIMDIGIGIYRTMKVKPATTEPQPALAR